MASSFETYSQLLSNENISLAYDPTADTASFNIKSRTITLPVMDFLGQTEMQLLTAHEVGHAIFSKYKYEDFEKYVEKYGSLLNVIEDIYIESSIKKEYPGLTNIFKTAYANLNKKDFFGIKNTDVNTLHFFDRLNIYFKIGHCVNVDFTQEEREYVVKCFSLRSNEDVLKLCAELKQFMEEQKKLNQNSSQGNGASSSVEYKRTEDQNSGASFEKSDNANEEAAQETDNFNASDGDEDENQDPCSTYNNFESKLKEAIDENNQEMKKEKGKVESLYCISINGYINTNDNSYEALCDDVILELNGMYKEVYRKSHDLRDSRIAYENIQQDLESVKRIAKDGDAFFQTMKNAKKMRTAKRKQTGNVDFRRLVNYRTSENIFKIKKLTEKEQNHAVTIMIDYSGSMHNIIDQVLMQALLTCEFCKRNNIRFDLYLFGANQQTYHCSTLRTEIHCKVLKIADSNGYNPEAIYTLFSTNFDTIRRAMRTNDIYPGYGRYFTLGITPLINASLVIWHSLNMQKRMGYDKTHCILISDGDNSSLFGKDSFSMTFNGLNAKDELGVTVDSYNLLTYSLSRKIPSYFFMNGIPYQGIPQATIANNVIHAILLHAKQQFGTYFTFSYLFNSDYSVGTSFLMRDEMFRNSNAIDNMESEKGITIKEPIEDSFADSVIIWNYSKRQDDRNTKFTKANTARNVSKYLQKKHQSDKVLSVFITEMAKRIA